MYEIFTRLTNQFSLMPHFVYPIFFCFVSSRIFICFGWWVRSSGRAHMRPKFCDRNSLKVTVAASTSNQCCSSVLFGKVNANI